MKVTVLITSYNYGKFIRRTIRSLLNQTMNKSDYEILVVDDCSTDDSLSILMEYPQIRLISNKTNVGLGASCKIGAAQALGQYIVRVDADDYVHEDFLKVLYLYSSLNRSSAVACDYLMVDSNENLIKRESQINSPIACGIMFKTDLLHEIGSYSDLRINEDADLLERFNKKYKMDYLNIPLYRYFIHMDSLSNKN